MIDFKVVLGFCFQTDERTDGRTDICDCRVAFATEKIEINKNVSFIKVIALQLSIRNLM